MDLSKDEVDNLIQDLLNLKNPFYLSTWKTYNRKN